MKTMFLTGLRQMAMREAPMPEIRNDTDVLLKLAVVGVCGSDVHYYTRGKIGSQVVRYPFPVGHECAAMVEQVGRGVTRVKPGDRVAVDPAMPCGQCDQCQAGRSHTCRSLRFLGCPGQAEGCLSEYIVMPQGCCFPVAPTLSFEQACLAEPLSIGLYAVRLSGLGSGDSAAILGCGPIGLSAMLCARVAGARKLFATDPIPARLAAADKAGATWIGNPKAADVVKAIQSAAPLGLDVVFECCGEQEALDQAVDLLKPGGKLVLVGIPTVDRISFPIDKLRRREIAILNVRRQNECVEPALELIRRRLVDADFMVTHGFPFDRTADAFELVADYRDGVIKAMIRF
jgi:L-iditol 2-dehydrogenase